MPPPEPEPRRRDLASRVEEQSERIAALARELEDVKDALARRDAEIQESHKETEKLRTQIADAQKMRDEADASARKLDAQVVETKADARRMASEVVRLREELAKIAGLPSQPPSPDAIDESAPNEVKRIRRELAATNEALAALRVSYRAVESEILALQRASNEMMATQYLDEVLSSILSGVEEGLGYDLAVLMVLDRAGGYFFPRVRPENAIAARARTDVGASFDRLHVPLAAAGNVIAGLQENQTLAVYETPRPMLDGAEPPADAERLGTFLVTAGGQQTFAAVPMVVRGQLAGAIFCCRSRAGISPRERESLQNFANQAGMSIENAQLVNDMRRVRDELARKNDDLAKTNEKLLELERTKEALTSMMVHDMKNPLTSIRGYLELLMDEPSDKLPDELKKHVRISYESSGRLLDMVRDLLDISKMEAGKFKLASEVLDLKSILDGVYAEQSIIAQRGGKTIVIELPADLPPVAGDRDLIGRVLTNVVSNSVKHTPRGSRIRVAAQKPSDVPAAPPESAIVLAVIDNGEGIPKEYHEKIFEKFGTVETRQSGAPKLSTGLGLTFCRMAVDAHGGKIWVESEKGKGATFYIALRTTPPA